MTIGEKIYELRTARQMTQGEFGKIAGVSDVSVSCWESGKKEPRLGAVKKICTHFILNVSSFIDPKEELQMAFIQSNPLVNNDPELTEYLEELRNRPEQRMLLSVTKDATKEEVEAVVNFITSLRRGKPDD